MPLGRLVAAFMVVCGLAACAGGENTLSGQASLVRELRNVLKQQPEASEIVVTRALLDQLTIPSVEVVAELRDQTAYLVPFSRRGPVTVWTGEDGAQVVLRQGLVTSTRGIGNDLVSSDHVDTLAALSRGRGTSTRRLFVRNDLGHEDSVMLTCTVETQGPARLDVVEKIYATVLLHERCETAFGQIRNEYWVQPTSGLIRQSRQWLGPELGYFRLRVLKADS